MVKMDIKEKFGWKSNSQVAVPSSVCRVRVTSVMLPPSIPSIKLTVTDIDEVPSRTLYVVWSNPNNIPRRKELNTMSLWLTVNLSN